LRDTRFKSDFSASFACCTGNRFANGTHTTALKSPGAEVSINFTHVMMQQYVCSSG
jgi:hypothetical protein